MIAEVPGVQVRGTGQRSLKLLQKEPAGGVLGQGKETGVNKRTREDISTQYIQD